MGDGDPVGQRQFAETMAGTEKRILDAVDKVNGGVQDNRVAIGKVETKLDTHEQRMDGQDTRMENQDQKIDDQKKWNRGLAAVEALIVAGLAAVGINKQ